VHLAVGGELSRWARVRGALLVKHGSLGGAKWLR
jgi:hypothetical protein